VGRRLTPCVLLTALTLGSGLGIGLGMAQAPQAASPVRPAAPTHLRLPPGDDFQQIAVENGRLVLTGEVASTINQQTPTCVTASVNIHRLQIGPVVQSNCGDELALGGEPLAATATPVVQELPYDNDATFSLATRDAAGSTSVGPVLFTFCYCSSTRPITVVGDGWLWIFDNSLNGSELIQASPTTGAVVDRRPMPFLDRPNITVGDGGLWIGNSLNGGNGPDALYFVAPGASAPIAIVPGTDLLTCWVVSDATHVWVGMGEQRLGCSTESVWKFVGTSTAPVFKSRSENLDTFTVVGDEADGLWTMRWQHQETDRPGAMDRMQVVRIDPNTGATRVTRTLSVIPFPASQSGGLQPDQAVVTHDSLLLLSPPFNFGGWFGFDSLVKLPLKVSG